MKKIFLKTFGCRVNQVESQSIREAFEAQGALFTADIKEADVCLVNTCTVTANADKDADRLIRSVLNKNPNTEIILTGCYASAQKEKIKEKFPVARVLDKEELGAVLFNDENFCWTVRGHEGHSRAFVKIQDGCDCFCSYCIVPYGRKKLYSKPLKEIIKEIQNILASGFREIVLTGINIGNYKCPETGVLLDGVLKELFKIEGDFRVRLSSIEPQTVTAELLAAAKDGGGKFCEHFHIPLQSGSDEVLKEMKRHYNTAEYKKKIEQVRSFFPEAGIYADVIAGFPSETLEEFEKSAAFIDDLELAGLHVFAFSSRPFTPAAKMKQLPPAEIKRRSAALREKDGLLREAFAKKQTGRTLTVLAEEYSAEEGGTVGVAGNFQRVIIEGEKGLKGLVRVTVLSASSALCTGQPVL